MLHLYIEFYLALNKNISSGKIYWFKLDKEVDKSKLKEIDSEGVKKSKKSKYNNKFKTSWLEETDENGQKLNKYIRPVVGSPCSVMCVSCNKIISLATTGRKAILRHAMSASHKRNISTTCESSVYFEKITKTTSIEISLVAWMATHNVSLNAMSCLSKILKKTIPNVSCSRTKVNYQLKNVFSKTEMENVYSALKEVPFSLSLDSGSHGRQKRTNVLVRYFDKVNETVVTRFLTAGGMNKETSENLYKFIKKTLVDEEVPRENCVQVLTDSCNVMVGVSRGLIPRLAHILPVTRNTNLGGDPIHHLHNATKQGFKESFGDVHQLLLDLKYELVTSPAKCEAFYKVCQDLGFQCKRIQEYFPTRFLSSGTAIEFVLEYFPAFQAYYSGRNDVTIYDDKIESDIEDDAAPQKATRISRLKSYFNNETNGCDMYLKLKCASWCLDPSMKLLSMLQSESIIIHKLGDILFHHLKQTLSSIVRHDLAMKTAKQVMNTVVESKKQKESRQEKEKSSHSKDMMTRIETSEFLLASDIQAFIGEMIETYHLNVQKAKDFRGTARRLCLNFKFKYFVALQKYLRLDKPILDELKFLCPGKIKDHKATENIKKLSRRLVPYIKEHELDQVPT